GYRFRLPAHPERSIERAEAPSRSSSAGQGRRRLGGSSRASTQLNLVPTVEGRVCDMLGAFWTEASEKLNRLTSKYEPIQPFVLVALARRLGCDAFIDVGANIGFYSILMALSGTVREVHAFEASNGAFGELKANIVNRPGFSGGSKP